MATQLQEPETTLTPVDPEAGRDFETEARKMGFVSEEEWPEGKPKPPEFKDAETFVRDAESKAGLQKQTINHLKEKISFLERQQRRLMQSEQNAHKIAMEEVRREMREAVRTGDEEAFDALDKKADALRKDMDGGSGSQEDATPHILSFRRENPWYDRGALAAATEIEVEARAYADLTADQWVAEGKPKTMPPSQFYKELDEAVNERFPQLKTRPAARQKPASDVAAPTTRGATSRAAKTGANLPAEAKQQAERYMRMKVPGFTKCKSAAEAHELFAKSYQWE